MKQRKLRLSYEPYPREKKIVDTQLPAPPLVPERTTYVITHQDLDHLKRKYSFSSNVTQSIASDLRSILQNRYAVEPHYREHCIETNQSLSDLFKITECEGLEGAICSDVPTLINRIMEARGLTSRDIKLQKIGLDQGNHRVFRCSGLWL